MSKASLPAALAGVLLAATLADAALCKKKSGAILVREKCRRKEVQVDPAQVGLVGPKGDPGAAGAGQPRMFVTDANGTRLPGFVNARGQLIYPVDGLVFSLSVGTGGFRDSVFFRYESADCTGPRLMFKGDDVVQIGNVVGGLLHRAGEPVQSRMVRSTQSVARSAALCPAPGVFDPTTRLCCRANQQPQSEDLAPAVTVDLRGFVPPFTLGIEQ